MFTGVVSDKWRLRLITLTWTIVACGVFLAGILYICRQPLATNHDCAHLLIAFAVCPVSCVPENSYEDD